MCKSHYINCLIKELDIDNSLGKPTYTPTTLTKEEIVDNHRSVLFPLEFQPKRKNWIYHHSTGFLNYTSVLSNSGYIAGSAKCSTKPLSKLLTCILSGVKTGASVTVTLATRGVVWIRCGFWRSVKSTYNLGPSPPAIALKHLTSLPSTQLFLTLSWRTN